MCSSVSVCVCACVCVSVCACSVFNQFVISLTPNERNCILFESPQVHGSYSLLYALRLGCKLKSAISLGEISPCIDICEINTKTWEIRMCPLGGPAEQLIAAAWEKAGNAVGLNLRHAAKMKNLTADRVVHSLRL